MKTVEEWEKEIEELIGSKSKDQAFILERAVKFAKKAHEGCVRKGSKIPYIVHPYEVCLVASTVTSDIDILVGALLHDVVEDTSYTVEDIRREFGDRVAGFVADESEDKMKDIPKELTWNTRKQHFIEHLKSAPIESKTICMADKISNLRSSLISYEQEGDAMWKVFNQKDPKMHGWYYRMIGNILKEDFDKTKAYKEYCELFEKIFGEAL